MINTPKLLISLVGLSFELIGVFFLSIPIIWDVKKLIHLLYLPKKRFLTGLIETYKKSGKNPDVKFFIFIVILIEIFIYGILICLFYLTTSFDTSIWGLPEPLVNIAVTLAMGPVIATMVSKIIIMLSYNFLEWVSRGEQEREKRVGRFGFILICIGFIFQCIFNVLSIFY